MEKIASFKKNHDKLQRGFYESGLIQGVTTFDLRFCKPNSDYVLTPKSAHTIEHLVATTLRNGAEKENIIYFGPMGCRTGFYLLTVNLPYERVKEILIEAVKAAIELNEIPGSRREECGNYREHDLATAKEDLKKYLALLEGEENE